jgi:hypothetical protein
MGSKVFAAIGALEGSTYVNFETVRLPGTSEACRPHLGRVNGLGLISHRYTEDALDLCDCVASFSRTAR